MSQPTPEEIRIRGRALTVLRQVLRAAAPEEGCALLLGHSGLPGAEADPGVAVASRCGAALRCSPVADLSVVALGGLQVDGRISGPTASAAGSPVEDVARARATAAPIPAAGTPAAVTEEAGPGSRGCPPQGGVAKPPAGSQPAALSAGSPCCWQLELIWPCQNVWLPADERRRRFALDPREQLNAQRWGRDRGLRVLGAAHSHPGSAPQPSATDQRLAVMPSMQLILSPLQDWQPSCWWLEADANDRPTARPLRWRMVD